MSQLKLNITTPRLFIRNLKDIDLEDFYIYRSNPDITKYQGFDVMTLEEAQIFIKEHTNKNFGKPGEWVQYAIENKETGNIVGDCAIKLNESDIGIAEIGITISHFEQKKGYAKETLSALMNFLFTSRNIHNIVETVDTENIASIHLLKSLGFKQQGSIIENIFFKGKWGSEVQFTLLKTEWHLSK